MLSLNINGVNHSVDVEPEMPLLWVIREQIGLTGTKFGCGIAQCGACTVHVNGEPVRSWQILAAASLLKRIPKPTDKDIDDAMTNICRCGSYQRIRAAIHMAAGTGKGIGSVIHYAGPGAANAKTGISTDLEIDH